LLPALLDFVRFTGSWALIAVPDKIVVKYYFGFFAAGPGMFIYLLSECLGLQ
jgi:hypothetical protein